MHVEFVISVPFCSILGIMLVYEHACNGQFSRFSVSKQEKTRIEKG